jgi:hypothetical protein
MQQRVAEEGRIYLNPTEGKEHTEMKMYSLERIYTIMQNEFNSLWNNV